MVARKASSVHNTWGVKHGNVFIANKQCLAYVWILSYWRISKQLDECAALVLWPRHKSWSIIIDNWQYGDFRSPYRNIKLAKVTFYALVLVDIQNTFAFSISAISCGNEKFSNSSSAIITYICFRNNKCVSFLRKPCVRPTLYGFTAANILCSHCAILAVFGFWNVGGSAFHNPMNA